MQCRDRGDIHIQEDSMEVRERKGMFADGRREPQR